MSWRIMFDISIILCRITGFTIYKRAVAIPSSLLTHDDKGQTVVGFYIQIPEGFVAFSTIKHSVEVEFDH